MWSKFATYLAKEESMTSLYEKFDENMAIVDLGEYEQKLMFLHYPISLPYKQYLSLFPAYVEENIRTGEQVVTPLLLTPCS